MMPTSISELNALSTVDFIDALSDIFEHSSWVAEAVASQRPFLTIAALHAAMCEVVEYSCEARQLALLRAHPELAGKAALLGELSAESADEQNTAGLTRCTQEEFGKLLRLNADHNAKFGFPFILAVRGHNRQSILQNFARRLANDRASEMDECLLQVYRIAELRLNNLKLAVPAI